MSQHEAKENLGQSAQAFAQGMLSVLQPVVVECDSHMQRVLQSQSELSEQIDLVMDGKSIN